MWHKTAIVRTQDQQDRKSVFSRIVILLKLLVSSAAIYWLFSTIQWDSFFERLTDVKWPILGLSLSVFLLCVLPCALRWRQIAELCGYPITFRESVRYYLIGSFFNAFLPTGRGGDAARAVLAARYHRFSLGGILGTVFVERFIGFVIALCFVMLTSLFVISRFSAFKNVLISAVVLIVFLAILIIISFSRFFRGLLHRFFQRLPFLKLRTGTVNAVKVLDTIRDNPRVIASAAGLSLLNQLIIIFAGFVMGFAIPGFDAPWFSFPVVIPLVFIAALLPSVGGYGVREAGYVIFFGWFGVGREAAMAFGILQLLFFWVFSLVGAILFVISKSTGESEQRADSVIQETYPDTPGGKDE